MDKVDNKIDFDNKLKEDKVVIALFRVEWCPDCHFIDPFMGSITDTFNSDTYTFCVDSDEVPELKSEYNISGIPSFVAFKGGKEINRFVSRVRKTEAEIRAFYTESLEK